MNTLKSAIFAAFLLISLSACNKNDATPRTELFDADLKNLELNTGFTDNGIPIKAETWSVQYVKDAASGELLEDKDGKPMILDAFGSVELLNGWLTLEKKQEDNLLNITLRENLTTTPRKFLIGILADGKQDELSFTQTRGEGYAIVEKTITEIPGSRKEYISDEGCYATTLTNHSALAENMETTEIFKDVNYMSEFSSEDVNAFGWINAQDSLIFMDEVLKDGAVWWANEVPYTNGQSFEPYIKAGNKNRLLVQPHASVDVRGEIVYLERECLYTFTIKNLSSGHTFDISGTWKQKIPLSANTILY